MSLTEIVQGPVDTGVGEQADFLLNTENDPFSTTPIELPAFTGGQNPYGFDDLFGAAHQDRADNDDAILDIDNLFRSPQPADIVHQNNIRVDEPEDSSSGAVDISKNNELNVPKETDDTQSGEAGPPPVATYGTEAGHANNQVLENSNSLDYNNVQVFAEPNGAYADLSLSTNHNLQNNKLSHKVTKPLNLDSGHPVDGINVHAHQEYTSVSERELNDATHAERTTYLNSENGEQNKRTNVPDDQVGNISFSAYQPENIFGALCNETCENNLDGLDVLECAHNHTGAQVAGTSFLADIATEGPVFEDVTYEGNVLKNVSIEHCTSDKTSLGTMNEQREFTELEIPDVGKTNIGNQCDADPFEALVLDSSYGNIFVEPTLPTAQIAAEQNVVEEIIAASAGENEGEREIVGVTAHNEGTVPSCSLENLEYVTSEDKKLMESITPFLSTQSLLEASNEVNRTCIESDVQTEQRATSVQIEPVKVVIDAVQDSGVANETVNERDDQHKESLPLLEDVDEKTNAMQPMVNSDQTVHATPDGNVSNIPTNESQNQVGEQKMSTQNGHGQPSKCDELVVSGVDYIERDIVINGVPCDGALECHMCGHFFHGEVALQKHKFLAHCTGGDFVCTICKQTFGSKSNHDLHVKGLHTKDGKEKKHCDKEGCGGWFNTQRQLSLHKRRMHGADVQKKIAVKLAREKQNKKSYTCTHCSSVLSSKYAAAKHILKYHPKTTSSNNKRKRVVGSNEEECSKRVKTSLQSHRN